MNKIVDIAKKLLGIIPYFLFSAMGLWLLWFGVNGLVIVICESFFGIQLGTYPLIALILAILSASYLTYYQIKDCGF